ncbi:MAG: S49 family peptidase [Anaerolineae bacterium]|nr:S49 family peptidase [Anaerolineae bacterium]
MNADGLSRLVRRLVYVVAWGVTPLVIGLIVALAVFPVPRVGVVRFEGVIWAGSIGYLGDMLDAVAADRSIRAIVLEIDSPGGDVTATEELYFRLLQLRAQKPLVVTVDYMAASGAYYLAAAADWIYAKPTSLVGNVGVISFLPSLDEQRIADEDFVSTGPFKFSGGSRGDYMRQIELAKLGFLEAVYVQRDDRLQIDRDGLAGGEIYMGVQALELGLVDALGANSEAVTAAADMAGLRTFRVVDVNWEVHGEVMQDEAWASRASSTSVLAARDPGWRERLYYLYVEPQKRRQ